jgi:pimeloyl-ACP methyl ester carboxylesterase
MNTAASTPQINRAFLRIAEGLIHYRHAGAPSGEPPLWMMHAAPASSRSLEPLIGALAAGRRVYAPDTPGYGDSVPLAAASPEITDYADAMLRSLDALGLEVVDLYGFHTGAHIAIEMALAAPQRVRRIVLDGLLVLDDAAREEFLAHYAPEIRPDAAGLQFTWAVNYIRDQAWFFPHFRRDAAHNLGRGAMSAEVLHYLATELVKAIGTYHLGYRAVFRLGPDPRGSCNDRCPLPATALRAARARQGAADRRLSQSRTTRKPNVKRRSVAFIFRRNAARAGRDRRPALPLHDAQAAVRTGQTRGLIGGRTLVRVVPAVGDPLVGIAEQTVHAEPVRSARAGAHDILPLGRAREPVWSIFASRQLRDSSSSRSEPTKCQQPGAICTSSGHSAQSRCDVGCDVGCDADCGATCAAAMAAPSSSAAASIYFSGNGLRSRAYISKLETFGSTHSRCAVRYFGKRFSV